MLHSATTFTDSEYRHEPSAMTLRFFYHWWIVWTAIQVKMSKCRLQLGVLEPLQLNVTILAIKLSDDMTEDTNYFVDKRIASTTLAAHDSTANKATETVTLAA